MKDIARVVFAITLVALVVALVLPGGIFVWRLMDTWSETSTAQLLGGMLACLGGMGLVFAMMAGAGAFARLAGWKPPRRDEERVPPMIIDAPPGWDDRPQLNAPPVAPPWGATGGGQFELLPPPQQDRRYSMSAERRERDR